MKMNMNIEYTIQVEEEENQKSSLENIDEEDDKKLEVPENPKSVESVEEEIDKRRRQIVLLRK